MNKILVILCGLLIAGCGNLPEEKTSKESGQIQQDKSATDPATEMHLRENIKYRADETTRRNVDSLTSIINDNSNKGEANRVQLTEQVQKRIEILVQQCKMKGPDHDALHEWLEKVLDDLKRLKKEDNPYETVYDSLKNDVESFYVLFE